MTFDAITGNEQTGAESNEMEEFGTTNHNRSYHSAPLAKQEQENMQRQLWLPIEHAHPVVNAFIIEQIINNGKVE